MYRSGRPQRRVIPLNLIVDGRSAVVFGGGRVGLRKVRGLLDAGATVTLVCPACVDELETLVAAKKIRRLKRKFRSGDCAGKLVAFACTDDKHANRAILEDARKAHVPCCCSDMNWADGDFTTPATARLGDMAIAVSTGGQNCVAARDMRNEILAHFAARKNLELYVIGTSDACLPSRKRAPFHMPGEARARFGAWVRELKGVREFAVLNTCHRVEVALVASDDASVDAVARLAGFDRLDAKEQYRLKGFDAFCHLVRVASGLESSLLGEFHVVSQVKDAFEEAAAARWSGPALAYVCAETLRVSKAVRHAVEGLVKVAEIDQVAARYLAIHGDLDARSRVTVVGTGVVGTGVVKALAGTSVDWVWHRNRPADALGAKLVAYKNLEASLAKADAVVCAVDVAEPVVTPAMAKLFAGRDVLFVDLGLPRNVDLSYDDMGGVSVVDLDALKLWHRVKSGVLKKVLAKADAVIREEYRGVLGAGVRG